jgi:hypothetical protein
MYESNIKQYIVTVQLSEMLVNKYCIPLPAQTRPDTP